MIAVLKRYSMALVFLLLVIFLMVLGTMGVMSFGDSMVNDIGVEMQPRGEHIAKELIE
ncbi:MAG: hypothetical protein J7K14_08890 [Sulfurimonas sp.]|nr:hypothetical protein [Sulfurimonas sp.]